MLFAPALAHGRHRALALGELAHMSALGRSGHSKATALIVTVRNMFPSWDDFVRAYSFMNFRISSKNCWRFFSKRTKCVASLIKTFRFVGA